MKQVFNVVHGNISTFFCNPFAFAQGGTVETSMTGIVPCAGTLRNLRIRLTTAPGAGTSRTIKVRKNGVDTSLSITISGTSTFAEDTSNQVVVAAGDRITLIGTVTGSPASTLSNQVSLEFEGDVSAQNFLSGGAATPSNSARQFSSPTGDSNAGQWYGTENDVSIVIPHSCTITELYGYLHVAPGAGKSRAFSIYKNGSEEASSIFTISDANQSGNITGLSISCVAGDRISISTNPSGTPASSGTSTGILFESAIDGESIICNVTVIAGSGTEYQKLMAHGNNGIANTTIEANGDSEAGTTSFSLKNLTVRLATAPGAGKSRTFKSRKNAADGGLSVLISETATTGSDTSNSDSISVGDLIDVSSLATSSPAVSAVKISMTQFIGDVPPAAVVRTLPLLGAGL